MNTYNTIVYGYFITVIALVIGWISNIVKLLNAPAVTEWGSMEVLRLVGIILAPLGGVLGWF